MFNQIASINIIGRPPAAPKSYDYLLKVLLVGDSDVGKQEILQDLEDGSADSPFCSGSGKHLHSDLNNIIKLAIIRD